MDALDEFQEQLYDHLEDFISNSDETEISFSTDLGFEQRRLVHIVASRMGLQHYSTGSGAYRYISVKKPIHFMNKRRNTGKRHRMNQNGPSLPPPSPPPRNNNNNNYDGFVDYQSENSWHPAEPNYNNHHQPIYKMISNERCEAPDIRGRFEDDTRDRSDYVADRGGKYNNNSNNYNNNNDRSDYVDDGYGRNDGDEETRHHGRRNYNNNNNSQEGYYNNQERKSNNNYNNNNNNNTNNYNNDRFGREKRRRGEDEEYERENEPTRHLPYNNNNTYNSYNNNNNNNTTNKSTITSEHNYYDNYFGYNNSRKQRRIIIRERKIYHTHFTEEDAERNKPYINSEARPPNVRGRGYVRWGAELEADRFNDHHDNHHHHNHHSHHNHLIGFHDADTHYHDSNHPRNLSLFSQGHVLIEEIRTPPDH